MELTNAIAKRIEDLLFEKNMTQYRLIKITCLNEKTVFDIMKGRSKDVKFSTITNIAFAFGLSLTEFFNDPVFAEDNLEY